MKIGDLDTRITFMSKSTTRDNFGQPIETFTKDGKAWAKRFDRNAGETIVGDQVVQIVRTEFTIRYKGDIDETYQIQHSGKTYRIEGIMVMGRNRWMKIICSEHGE